MLVRIINLIFVFCISQIVAVGLASATPQNRFPYDCSLLLQTGPHLSLPQQALLMMPQTVRKIQRQQKPELATEQLTVLAAKLQNVLPAELSHLILQGPWVLHEDDFARQGPNFNATPDSRSLKRSEKILKEILTITGPIFGPTSIKSAHIHMSLSMLYIHMPGRLLATREPGQAIYGLHEGAHSTDFLNLYHARAAIIGFETAAPSERIFAQVHYVRQLVRVSVILSNRHRFYLNEMRTPVRPEPEFANTYERALAEIIQLEAMIRDLPATPIVRARTRMDILMARHRLESVVEDAAPAELTLRKIARLERVLKFIAANPLLVPDLLKDRSRSLLVERLETLAWEYEEMLEGLAPGPVHERREALYDLVLKITGGMEPADFLQELHRLVDLHSL